MATYKIDGETPEPSRILVIDESNQNIVSNVTVNGPYSITGLVDNNPKTILCRADSSGETVGYGGLTPVEIPYPDYVVDNFNLEQDFNYVYWLDGTNGNDANNGLSQDNAFKTWDGAYNKMANGSDRCLIIMPGHYYGNQYAGHTYCCDVVAVRYQVSYIAAFPGQVIVENCGPTAGDVTQYTARDANMFQGANQGKFYGIVFRHYVGSRTLNYSVSIMRWANADFYNCAFTDSTRNTSAKHSLNYDNTDTYIVNYRNCTFWMNDVTSVYSGEDGIFVYNSLCGPDNFYTNHGTYSNCIGSATLTNHTDGLPFWGGTGGGSPAYWCTSHSNSTYGVYSGTYNWPNS